MALVRGKIQIRTIYHLRLYVDIAKQIIDQRVYKILADNPDLFSADDAEHKRSKAFLLLGVASYLDIDIAEAIRH